MPLSPLRGLMAGHGGQIDALPNGEDEEKYIVAISTGEAVPTPKGDHRTTIMTGADGVQYVCAIPVVANSSTDASNSDEGQNDDKSRQADNPLEYLEPLAGKCILLQEQWWAYEVCYQHYVRQFHQEDDSAGMEFLLGKFDGETRSDREVKVDESATSKNNRYVSHRYVSGDICEETQSPRETEVRYFCEERTSVSTTSITTITEGPTCKYTININTPLLCRHPEFQMKDNTHAILCHPLNPKKAAPTTDEDGSKEECVSPPAPQDASEQAAE
ncbi:unnamed protein product [Ostreobium quekettii]|uniref:MRH domain-containing protein n=1 Tax=Ostreobium quekettii TaxID=121088 RepID=A0A8S1J2D5_9CHLO|nr:unnamed protein product [Ostreobium quekettii]|eukprot:evm.model.scf_416.4 EVM.evm.TU.scf_416.4   scf_416:60821-65326(+)